MRTAGTTMLLVFSLASAAIAAPAELTDYHPAQKLDGTFRSRGDSGMASLMKLWEKGFSKYHPKLHFEATLDGTDGGIYGLDMRTADVAVMGRPMNPFERYGTYERSGMYPIEIQVATGSASAPANSPAYAILVNKDNPLSKLSLKQLDGIFGGQREGGWNALSWMENAARGPEGNIRTWGQLGLTGEWANKPIHVYGPPLGGAGAISYFQTRVLKGGSMWNEDLREYVDLKAMAADIAHDPCAIGYSALGYGTAGLKTLAVGESDSGPFVTPSPRSVADRSYPLARPVFLDYTIDNEKSEMADPRVEPMVKEFLRYVLSKQGQQDVVRDGHYLPLPPAVVRAQLAALDSVAPPSEKDIILEEYK